MKKLFFLFTALLLLTLPIYSQTLPSWVPGNGLVAFWPMSGNGNDASGNAHHGVVHGASLISDRFGTENSAFSFDGKSFIDVRDTASLNPTSGLTLSMWVQTTTDHSLAGVLGKWNNYGGTVGVNKEQFCFNVADTNHGVNFGLKTKDNYKVYPHEDTVIYKNGNWNHYVGTYDGSYARLYVNGRMVSSYRTSGPIEVFEQNFEIGRIAGGQPTCATAYYFTGNIDDVGMWNRALTVAEISALLSGCPGLEASITPLGDLSFCLGGSVDLKTSVPEGASVQWFRNDTLIAGAVDSVFTASRSGNYSVILTKGDCRSTSPHITVEAFVPAEATISASGPLVFCDGGNVILTAHGGDSFLWNTGDATNKITVSKGGLYSVVITSGTCITEASVSVTVHPRPTASINTLESFIEFHDDPVKLSGQPSGGTFSGKGISNGLFYPSLAGLGKSVIAYTYTSPEGCNASDHHEVTVFDTTGVVCTSFDTLTVTLFDTISVTRFDTVHVTVYDSLLVSSSIVTPDTMVVVSTLTSNGTQATRELLKLYPNPAKTHLNIQLSEYARQNNYALVIKNSLGQALFSSDALQVLQTINLASWSPGVYLVYLEDDNGSTTEIRKVIIQ